MALSNRDRIDRALQTASAALDPFISQHLAQHIPAGHDWTAVLRAKDELAHGPSDRSYSRNDIQAQLRILTERLGSLAFPFNEKLSRAESNLASELRDVRSSWAHGGSFSFDDTYRALDTVERLLRAIGAGPQADTVKTQRAELQRTNVEAQTRRDVRDSGVITGLGDTELRPWRDVIAPHDDVLSGRFTESEFAANLHTVAHTDGHGSPEYDEPVEFFHRTFLTEGLQDLLGQAARRVGGDMGASPVINLQTTFGGGKTHSMLAVWHLFSGTPIVDLPQGMQELWQESGASLPPGGVRRVAVVGNEMAPNEVTVKPDGTKVHTIWGEIAWQLGGAEAYASVAESDRKGTSPGQVLRQLLRDHSPCVILIDEWVAYARQLRSDQTALGGTFDAQFSFAQALTEAVSATPGALLLVSIPASDARIDEDGKLAPIKSSQLETGGVDGLEALQRLEHVVSRVAHQWQPASAQESFEIVRRRLFEEPSGDGLRQIAATARRFSSFYQQHTGEFPAGTTDLAYEAKLRAAYPIHPELFDRLYEDWSTLERFQRTRGVLRLMSTVVRELHRAKDESPLIMPGSVPLSEPAVVGELIQYVDSSWRPIIDTDIDGQESVARRVDNERPLFGKRGLSRRISRSTFLASAATLGSAHKGSERKEVFLGVAMPGDTVGNFGSSLQMLADRSAHLFNDGDRYWYDLQPSLNRLVAERASQLSDDDVEAEIVRRLNRAAKATAGDFAAVIVAPTETAEVPEAESARLVLLGPRHQHKAKSTDSRALKWAADLFAHRASGNRDRRNTLVALAPDAGRYAELESAVRQYLGWNGIYADRDDRDFTQSNLKLIERKVDENNKTADQRVQTAWIWGLHPRSTGAAPFTVSALKVEGDGGLAARTGRRFVKEDLLRVQIAPTTIHMDLTQRLVKVWNNGRVRVGDLWDYYTRYPYMPRLRDRAVLMDAVQSSNSALAWEHQGFALATGYDESTGEFLGLALPNEDLFARVDDETWIVAPHLAQAQRARETQSVEPEPDVLRPSPARDPQPGPVTPEPKRDVKVESARYQGRVEVDASNPDRIGDRLKEIADEVVRHLAAANDLDTIEIVLDVSAESREGFDADIVRTVRENGRQLAFDENTFKDVQL
ncbi:DUF499 domain-containing protein [Ornithinimicrobium sp. Arc0846-15]|nr:DUF499 domain-containing protein [Ornithinimicrobium laminariae]